MNLPVFSFHFRIERAAYFANDEHQEAIPSFLRIRVVWIRHRFDHGLLEQQPILSIKRDLTKRLEIALAHTVYNTLFKQRSLLLRVK